MTEEFDRKYWPWAMFTMGVMLGSLIGLTWGVNGSWYEPGHRHLIGDYLYFFPDSKGTITIPFNGEKASIESSHDCFYAMQSGGRDSHLRCNNLDFKIPYGGKK